MNQHHKPQAKEVEAKLEVKAMSDLKAKIKRHNQINKIYNKISKLKYIISNGNGKKNPRSSKTKINR